MVSHLSPLILSICMLYMSICRGCVPLQMLPVCHSLQSRWLVNWPSVRSSVPPSTHPCSVNTFKTLKLQDCWADIDETWHEYSMGPGTKLLESGILNFGTCGTGKRWPTSSGVLISSISMPFQKPLCFIDYRPSLWIVHKYCGLTALDQHLAATFALHHTTPNLPFGCPSLCSTCISFSYKYTVFHLLNLALFNITLTFFILDTNCFSFLSVLIFTMILIPVSCTGRCLVTDQLWLMTRIREEEDLGYLAHFH